MKLINDDCLQSMITLEDNSIDCILSDLPYGVTANKWDCKIDLQQLWIQYKRVIKDIGTVILFGSQPFTTTLINSNFKDFRYCWYWEKNQGTNFFHAKRMPIRHIEEVCIFMKGKYNPQKTENHKPTNSTKGTSNGSTYHGEKKRNYKGGDTTRYPKNILKFKCVDNYSKIHSSQKPLKLMEYFIKTYTDEDDTILDNAMGSGTTGVACKNLNRNFIGMEIDEDIFNIAKKRLK